MQREQLEVDVLLVGAGPANLACALHLARLIERHNQSARSGGSNARLLESPTLLVIEKAREIGAHAFSGAVVDPRGFDELLADLPGEQPPYDSRVSNDALYLLSEKGFYESPVTPPPLNNHGLYVASLGKIVRWMAELCEKHGIDVYPEFPASELIFDGNRVI